LAKLSGDVDVDDARLALEANRERAKFGAAAETYVKTLAGIESSASQPPGGGGDSAAMGAEDSPPSAPVRGEAISPPERPSLSVSTPDDDWRKAALLARLGIISANPKLSVAVMRGLDVVVDVNGDGQLTIAMPGDEPRLLDAAALDALSDNDGTLIKRTGRVGTGSTPIGTRQVAPMTGRAMIERGAEDFEFFKAHKAELRALRAAEKRNQ